MTETENADGTPTPDGAAHRVRAAPPGSGSPEGRPVDPFDAACPSRRLLDRIGDRWTVLLVVTLGEGPHRFSELRRTVGGISQKMLTQTLRALERDGLVSRTVHAEVPPRVVYELTEAGHSLRGPLEALQQWAVEHYGQVSAAHDRYDATA